MTDRSRPSWPDIMPNAARRPLANAARTKARALFEKQLAKEPDNTALAVELADLLLIDTRWTVLKPAEMKSQGGATLTDVGRSIRFWPVASIRRPTSTPSISASPSEWRSGRSGWRR